MTDIEILNLSYSKPGAFGEIFDRYQGRFMERALRSLDSKDSAEDVVQTAFVKIYKYGHKFVETGGDFKSWSYKILQNCINDELSQKPSLVEITDEMESLLEAPSEFPQYESANFLESILKRMDRGSAKVLEMRYSLGRSFKQIGKMLGISSGAARVRAYRAKKDFMEIYKQFYYGK